MCMSMCKRDVGVVKCQSLSVREIDRGRVELLKSEISICECEREMRVR